MNGKISTHLYLPETLYMELSLLAKMQDTSLSAVIKNILATNIGKKMGQEKGSALLEKLAGYKIKGPKNLSKNYKKYLFN